MTRKTWTGIAAAFAMLALILDAKTALVGAREGLQLCIMTVIPSLFPFFFLSILLTSSLSGATVPLPFISKLTGIPKGSESVFLIGLIGGYPTGAQSVATLYQNGQLTKKQAERMLGFCSNAGPAFLFGIAAANFTAPFTGWILWIIHILSAIMVSLILPGRSNGSITLRACRQPTMQEILRKSLLVMAQVCGWILLFRLMIAYLNRWFLWYFEDWVQIAINGMVELTIGCTALRYIANEGLRLILCSALISFGGLCVTMQTASVTKELSLKSYFPGKILQTGFSVLLASSYQQLLLPSESNLPLSPLFYCILLLGIIIFAFLYGKAEKRCSIPALHGV